MKPHNHAAPGLGRTNDKLAGLANRYRKRINKELERRGRERDLDPAARAGRRRSDNKRAA
ncbi:hypothetical protein DS6A_91 [Mycobacterium phage DS6A]|uniref:Uncharacterized protein n=1 Tax=Mycobacterium phage DS6A TaxID=45764 RepID=G8I4K1_9CAUD|nr:hypothetical protein DS6A_91 [Mycobacterium phage DS6A]AER47645.1 hypothetical protein DS6A_91 [Mycobacterium phage DS6A]